MELKSLDIGIRKLWLIINIILLVLIGIVSKVGIDLSIGTPFELGVIISVCITDFIFLVLLIIFPFLKYYFYKFGYNDKKIVIHFGVIFKHRVVIPVCQIQDLHLYQGPLMSILKLNSVIISTAGSNFSISGLDKMTAEKMVEDLEKYLQTRIEELKNEEI